MKIKSLLLTLSLVLISICLVYNDAPIILNAEAVINATPATLELDGMVSNLSQPVDVCVTTDAMYVLDYSLKVVIKYEQGVETARSIAVLYEPIKMQFYKNMVLVLDSSSGLINAFNLSNLTETHIGIDDSIEDAQDMFVMQISQYNYNLYVLTSSAIIVYRLAESFGTIIPTRLNDITNTNLSLSAINSALAITGGYINNIPCLFIASDNGAGRQNVYKIEMSGTVYSTYSMYYDFQNINSITLALNTVAEDKLIISSSTHGLLTIGLTTFSYSNYAVAVNQNLRASISSVHGIFYDEINNALIVADTGNLSIKEFDVSNGGVTFVSALLYGKGSEIGRFYMPKDICYTQTGTLIVADTLNNRIQEITFTDDSTYNISCFGSLGNEEGYFVSPSLITCNYSDFIYVYDLNRIQVFTTSGEFVKSYNTVNSDLGTLEMGQIADLIVGKDNAIYAIDYTNNIIIKLGIDDTDFSVFIKGFDIGKTFDATTKLYASYNSNFLLKITDQLLSVFSSTNYYNTGINMAQFNFINDIFNGFDNNIYIMNTLTDQSVKIYKMAYSNGVYSLDSTLNINCTSLSGMCINELTGDIYFVSISNHSVLYLNKSLYSENFVTVSNQNYTHPVNISDCVMLTIPPDIANVCITETLLYSTPSRVVIETVLNENTSVIILSECEDYYYIIYADTDSQSYISGYVSRDDIFVIENDTQALSFDTARVIRTTVNIYKYPFISSSLIVQSVNKNTVLNLNSNVRNYSDLSGLKFYEVVLDDGIGYIERTQVIDSTIISPQDTAITNAYIKLSDEITGLAVYKTEGDLLSAISGLTLSNNTRVYITTNFNALNTWTEIIYSDEFGNEYSGFISTRYLIPDSENTRAVTAMILMAVAILLGLLTLIAQKYINKQK
ncbi:MAG: NHL repeat-containing protein [Clostridia bacterium]|nr:NHL repeat-containing protein [Clostridia bacterium]